MFPLFIAAISLAQYLITINGKPELKYPPDAKPITITTNLICIDKEIYDNKMLYLDKDNSEISKTCVYTTQQKS